MLSKNNNDEKSRSFAAGSGDFVANGIDASISGFANYQSPENYIESLLKPEDSNEVVEIFRGSSPIHDITHGISTNDTLPKMTTQRKRHRRSRPKRPPFHRWLLHQFGEPNFIKIHYLYILIWIFVVSILLVGPGGINYIDAFFLACAACTQGGMTTVDLNNLNTFQQAVLYVAPIFTSSVWTNSVLVWVRLRYFEWRFEGIYKKSDMNLKARIKTMSFNKEKMNFVQRSVTFFGSSNQGKKHTSNPDNGPISNSTSSNVPEGKVVFSNFFSRHHPDNLNKYQETNLQSEDMLENEGPKDMLEDSKESKSAKWFLSNLKHLLPWVKSNNIYNTISTYLDWEPQVKGNSVFIELDTQRKEELGGIEYKALRLLRKILLIYYYGFIIISGFLFAPWASMTKEYASVFETYSLNKIWWGIFLGQSAFNNVGFSLNPDSVIPFANNRFIVVMLAFIMIIGYSGFPCMLRLIIWGMSRCTGVNRDIHVTLTFLLEHPRRCFTLLFPSSTTWILFGIILMLNSIDLVLFIVLGLKNPVFESLNWNHKITTGIFQSAATRTSGLSVLNLADLHPGVQVLYAIMMYISVFPIAMSLRNTNVYEEKSLGIFLDDSSSSCSESEKEENQNSENFGTSETAPKRNNSSAKSSKIPNLGAPSKPTVWGAHIQQQLSFDMWFLLLFFCYCA